MGIPLDGVGRGNLGRVEGAEPLEESRVSRKRSVKKGWSI